MKSNETSTRALVLGGGGVAGIAWELGILIGLYDTGVDVRGADVIIGTSAGSVVGAQIASGTDLESLYASQLIPVEVVIADSDRVSSLSMMRGTHQEEFRGIPPGGQQIAMPRIDNFQIAEGKIREVRTTLDHQALMQQISRQEGSQLPRK